MLRNKAGCWEVQEEDLGPGCLVSHEAPEQLPLTVSQQTSIARSARGAGDTKVSESFRAPRGPNGKADRCRTDSPVLWECRWGPPPRGERQVYLGELPERVGPSLSVGGVERVFEGRGGKQAQGSGGKPMRPPSLSLPTSPFS